MIKNFLILAIIVMAICGCSGSISPGDYQYWRREQMLSAQKETITSVESEMALLYQNNGSDITAWSPQVVDTYQKWQKELAVRYAERYELIKLLFSEPY